MEGGLNRGGFVTAARNVELAALLHAAAPTRAVIARTNEMKLRRRKALLQGWSRSRVEFRTADPCWAPLTCARDGVFLLRIRRTIWGP
jgi:hypothetical protein